MNSDQNDCNKFITQKMAELVLDKEAIQTELTETKLELSNTKLQLDDANLKLENATLEIERLKQELQKKEESTSSSENILLSQETGLNIYDIYLKYISKKLEIYPPYIGSTSAILRTD